MGFDKHGIEVDGDCIWLLDAGGQRLCDLTEMQLLDFGRRISVEGGCSTSIWTQQNGANA